jgi:nicotinamide-nucleotide amidase
MTHETAITGAEVIDELRRQGLTVAVAESLTGGLLVAELIRPAGASDVVRGGVVAYATDLKHTVLGVDAARLAATGPVDAEVARQMASGVRASLGREGRPADIGISTTGVAGPGPQDEHPAGTVFIGLALGGVVSAHRLALTGDRDEIRAASVQSALQILWDALQP